MATVERLRDEQPVLRTVVWDGVWLVSVLCEQVVELQLDPTDG